MCIRDRHYTVSERPGPANVVPAKAVGKFSLRSFSRSNLEQVVSRFHDIIKGAALIAGVEYEVKQQHDFYNKIPVTVSYTHLDVYKRQC